MQRVSGHAVCCVSKVTEWLVIACYSEVVALLKYYTISQLSPSQLVMYH